MKFTKVIKAESEKERREAALRVIYHNGKQLIHILEDVLNNWNWDDNKNNISIEDLWKIARTISNIVDSGVINKLN